MDSKCFRYHAQQLRNDFNTLAEVMLPVLISLLSTTQQFTLGDVLSHLCKVRYGVTYVQHDFDEDVKHIDRDLTNGIR